MGFLDKLFPKKEKAHDHHGHDHDHHHGHAPARADGKVEDPVCHMRIDPKFAAGTSVHGRATYHFCSASCKQTFDADPHKYLAGHAH